MGVDYSCLFPLMVTWRYQRLDKYRMVPPFFIMKQKTFVFKTTNIVLRCLVLLWTLGFSLTISSQKVDKDETKLDGSRSIQTTEEEFYDDDTVGLTYEISKEGNDTTRYLNITLEDWGKMEAGRSFFLKFKDNTILELKNIIDQKAHPLSGHLGMFGPAMGLQPVFIVTREQLDLICKGEVVKLRFDQGNDIIDRKIKKNIFSKIVKNCRDAIEKTRKGGRDLLEGF